MFITGISLKKKVLVFISHLVNVNFLKIYLFTTSKRFGSGLDLLRQALTLLLRLASGLWQSPDLASSVLG